MTEQEAQAGAETLLKPLAKRHKAKTSVGYVEESYVEYWPAVKVVAGLLASRSPVAAPSDTDRETLARIITDMMPNVPLCCSGAAFKSEGHDQDPPCLTVIRGREIADAVLASRTSQPVQVEVTDDIGTKIAELSEWIDGSYPESLIGTELHVRRRVDKLMEESGEVGQAVGGWFGENPRKGVTHTRADVLAELLDVAVTALGAYESLTGNAGSSIPALDAKLNMILERAGLSAALGGGDHAE